MRSAPPWGARALAGSAASAGSPIGDQAPVGGLGALGRPALGGLPRAVLKPRPRPALPRWASGGEIEAVQLAPSERRPGEGVVLASGQQTPGEAGELAGHGHRGDLVSTAGAHPRPEGSKWPGLAHRLLRRL